MCNRSRPSPRRRRRSGCSAAHAARFRSSAAATRQRAALDGKPRLSGGGDLRGKLGVIDVPGRFGEQDGALGFSALATSAKNGAAVGIS